MRSTVSVLAKFSVSWHSPTTDDTVCVVAKAPEVYVLVSIAAYVVPTCTR